MELISRRSNIANTILLPQIHIPTATALVTCSNDPYKILVGQSNKHPFPVLPGGKIETQDVVSSNLEENAYACIKRELKEEIGTEALKIRFLEYSYDTNRDKRTIKAQDLRGTLVEDLVKDLNDTETVLGCYGAPDHLFIAIIDPAEVRETEELNKLCWIDCRKIDHYQLSAGHKEFVKKYLLRLNRLKESL